VYITSIFSAMFGKLFRAVAKVIWRKESIGVLVSLDNAISPVQKLWEKN